MDLVCLTEFPWHRNKRYTDHRSFPTEWIYGNMYKNICSCICFYCMCWMAHRNLFALSIALTSSPKRFKHTDTHTPSSVRSNYQSVPVSVLRPFLDSIVKEDWLYLTLCGFEVEWRVGWWSVACVRSVWMCMWYAHVPGPPCVPQWVWESQAWEKTWP